ncbi:MAG TPA: lytic transglycosylase domain-containing protein [Spirochaetota bacterium]|nr:lytic transglycosylase domain-containing protein [Spirochaetota bacterium]HOR45176.1 lytic transglycosylase domain-containing protein [Spirochaetota bacterium]HOU85803.1 lytic transglycosylase domain-containing protein [Spirochaetota bacterium]HPK56641.1 lytic transglycosylase domain-containing protein [Spirochaetota bacterium]HQE57872.1 lytic transglycosylase domain-containing protein [Spirochaetota bacterium]
MTEGVYACMERISEIKKRFGLMNENAKANQNAETAGDEGDLKRTFSEILSDRTGVSSSQQGNLSKDDIESLIEKISIKEGVSPSLVKAVVENESSYNTMAVSPKGAMGLMQLMPETAKELGVNDSFSAEENIEGGVKYLKGLLNKYQWDYKKALAAYNAGPKLVDSYNGVPPIKETAEYVKRVLNSYRKEQESVEEE